MRASSRSIGLYWGAVAIGLAIAAPFAPRIAGLLPPCLFRSLTGLVCPTCGATRAALALARLDLSGAVRSNPLAALSYVAFLVGGLAAGAASLAGRPLREPSYSGPMLRLAALLAVILNWVWLLVHSPHG